MASRITLKDITKNTFHKDVEKHIKVVERNHPDEALCRGSRWPFTDKLTFEEIMLMRDTYTGIRKTPTSLVTKTMYDRQTPKPGEGWDPRTKRDDRGRLQDFGISGRLDVN